MSSKRIMDFVGAIVLVILAIVLYTRPVEHVWFKVAAGAAALYAAFCLFRGFTRSEA
jgi:hypothetical protein